ncbi:MAG: hypothetical protein WCP70_11605 [Methanothrix sp.]
MNEAVDVTLPSGCWIEEKCHKSASLRPFCGDDEAILLEAGGVLLPAQWTTALLARCLIQLGTLNKFTLETVRSLNVGDREALLLHLRRITLGDSLSCLVVCPAKGCSEKIDLDLKVSDLILPPYSDVQPLYDISLSEGEKTYKVSFRLPRGGDQEAVATLARTSQQAAEDLLLSRCVQSITAEDGDAVAISPEIATRISSAMADLDPQAELKLNLRCPACGGSFSALFDTASYLSQELAGHMENIYREVHLLAFYYHWSEAEIMSMPSQKRQRYLELLANALGE